MKSEEQAETPKPSRERQIVGWGLMALFLGVAHLVMRFFEAELAGGLLIYIVGPPVFIVLWALLSTVVAIFLLERDGEHCRIMSGIGYALMLVLMASTVWFFCVFLNLGGASAYRGP
jgi:hypothetical protein